MTGWLVTGGTGLLGANALIDLRQGVRAVGAARNVPEDADAVGEFVRVDLSSPADRRGLVARTGVDHVLHTAAIATIEGCEADPDAAYELNVRASEDLAAQAYSEGARFLFISTDAVFDGRDGEYTESDPTSPISEYGRGKVEAEKRVLDANPDAIVARVNFYGWSPTGTRSLAEFFFNRLSSGADVGGFTDVRVSTTYVGHLVTALRELAATDAAGIFHVAAADGVSKYDFGRALAECFGFDPARVNPVLSTDVLAAPRGADLRLRTDRLRAALGRDLPASTDGLLSLRADRDAGRPQTLKNFDHS
ncbi:SDR family oxidoreductase [Microbacterium algeriense]|uniref:SDR family oxidoreductase n=1 Tax=Microbacterium algeriense TaxID=2615184 RepID=A0ABQ6VA13_9MICO|nr:SDR family oxidoreductase [Microbacterium algeriense]KAB1867113.1 SDR family oxidoreductase [Microbacterium algeriense]